MPPPSKRQIPLSGSHEQGMELDSARFQRPQVLWKSRALLGAYRLLFSTSDTSTSKIGFSKPPIECWVGAATQKREDSTGLSGCKQVCGVANVECFLKRYTIFCGFSPAISTMNSDSLLAGTFPSRDRISILLMVIRLANYSIP